MQLDHLDDESLSRYQPLTRKPSKSYGSLNTDPIESIDDPIFQNEIKEERGNTLGLKQLGTWLSVMFIVNQIYGPGVLAIPIVYHQAGIFTTNLMLFFFFIMSSFAATMLCCAISMIPGNKNFEKRIEYSNAVEHYYGARAKTIFIIFFNLTLQAYNIASIVICAQAFDFFFRNVCGATWAFEMSPRLGFYSYEDVDHLYSSNLITITAGYVAILLFCVPMSMLNLDDNVKIVQSTSFVALVILTIQFAIFFTWRGFEMDGFAYHTLPFFGRSQTQLVSVFIFSWAYPMFIPSWINEKSPEVEINFTVWISGFVSFIGYWSVGTLCAVTGHPLNDNMLFKLMQSPTPLITIISSYLYSLGVIAPGIPVCSITTRYNLYVARICGKKQSYFWGVFAPWLVSFIFCQGQIFAELLVWSSLIFNGLINFLLPLHIYYTALNLQTEESDDGENDPCFEPIPDWFGLSRKNKPTFVFFLFLLTLLVILTQIFFDFYELIFEHKDVLSS